MNRAAPRQKAGSTFASSRSIVIISVLALGFGLLGALIGAMRANGVTATASVTVGNAASTVFTEAAPAVDLGELEPFVESQVEILGSLEVARRAATILEDGPYSPSPDEVQGATIVERVPDTTEMEVTYGAEREVDAVAGANAVIAGYQNLMQQRWADQHTRAIASITESLERAEQETQRLVAETGQPNPGDGEIDLTAEMLTVIAELETLDEAVTAGATGTSLEALDARRTILATQVDAYETVLAEQLEGSRLSVAGARLDSALAREARLRERLIELEVDSRVDGYGVAFATPAVSASASSAGPVLAGIAGLVLGASLGLAVAYWMERDSDMVGSPAEARRLLGYPLLSIVDSKEGAPHDTGAATTDGRHSTSQLLARIRSRALDGEPQILGLVSADGESRTVAAVHLASECADDGLDVLVVDGDLGGRADKDGLTTTRGLADFVADELPLPSVIEERRTPRGSAFHALGSGESGLVDSLQPGDLKRALDLVESAYDAVIVSLPLSSLSGLVADAFPAFGCVVVVKHQSPVRPVASLLRGIEKRRVQPLGFVYAFDGIDGSTSERAPRSSHSGSRHR